MTTSKVRRKLKPEPRRRYPREDARERAMREEMLGRVLAPELYDQAGVRRPVREPFYLRDLGLHKEPFTDQVPRYQPGPIIRRRRT